MLETTSHGGLNDLRHRFDHHDVRTHSFPCGRLITAALRLPSVTSVVNAPAQEFVS